MKIPTDIPYTPPNTTPPPPTLPPPPPPPPPPQLPPRLRNGVDDHLRLPVLHADLKGALEAVGEVVEALREKVDEEK